MSDVGDVVMGLAAGVVIALACREAGLGPASPALIGGGAGLVLTMTERARPGGLALAVGSIGAALALEGSGRVRTRRALRRATP